MSDVPDPHAAERVASVIEWAAKSAIGLGTLKAFVGGVYKPFVTWRREHSARLVRDILAPELEALRKLIGEEQSNATRMEEVLTQTRMIFQEFDDVLEVLMDNRERLDETNGLLDTMGFSTERRLDERREEVAAMVDKLHERRKLRRRGFA